MHLQEPSTQVGHSPFFFFFFLLFFSCIHFLFLYFFIFYFYFRLFSKKECPSCRVKCASRRSLRADSNFDSIIRKIYPNLDEYEAKEAERLLQITELYNISNTLEEGYKRQSQLKKSPRTLPPKRSSKYDRDHEPSRYSRREDSEEYSPPPPPRSKRAASPPPHSTPSAAIAAAAAAAANPQAPASPATPGPPALIPNAQPKDPDSPEVEFVLMLHPSEKTLAQLEKRYIKTTVTCTGNIPPPSPL